MKTLMLLVFLFYGFHSEAQLIPLFDSPGQFADRFGQDYNSFGSNPGNFPNFDGYYLRNDSTGLIYNYSYNNYLNGQLPQAIDPQVRNYSSIPRIDGVFQNYLCCFYNNLPEKISAYLTKWGNGDLEAVVVNEFTRIPTPDQTSLKKAIEAIKDLPFYDDPFIAYGIDGLNYELIKNIKSGSREASPTHFSRLDGKLSVNANDLHEYGFVVLIHEVLHASLQKALSNKVISQQSYEAIALLNSSHFGDFKGYIGLNGYNFDHRSDAFAFLSLLERNLLGMEKAFTIGYTYKILKNHYSQLNANQKIFADRFIDDIEGNIHLGQLELCILRTCITDEFHMIDADATQGDIDFFTNSFTNPQSSINNILKTPARQIATEVEKQRAEKIRPAIIGVNIF